MVYSFILVLLTSFSSASQKEYYSCKKFNDDLSVKELLATIEKEQVFKSKTDLRTYTKYIQAQFEKDCSNIEKAQKPLTELDRTKLCPHSKIKNSEASCWRHYFHKKHQGSSVFSNISSFVINQSTDYDHSRSNNNIIEARRAKNDVQLKLAFADSFTTFYLQLDSQISYLEENYKNKKNKEHISLGPYKNNSQLRHTLSLNSDFFANIIINRLEATMDELFQLLKEKHENPQTTTNTLTWLIPQFERIKERTKKLRLVYNNNTPRALSQKNSQNRNITSKKKK